MIDMPAVLTHLALIAQAAAPAGAPQEPPAVMQMFPLIIFGILFYVLLIRPQMKRQKEQKNLLSSLKTGDQVVMIGGEHGLVTNVGETTVTVKVADNVKIKYQKTAVEQVVKSQETAETAAAAS